MIQVPAQAYQFKAAGLLSADEIQELEQMRDMLNKQADVGSALLHGAGAAVGGAAAVAAAHYFARGVDAAENSLTFNHDLKKVLEVHPDIKEHSDHDIRLAYQSIRVLNPVVAKDPLMGGTLLGQVLRNRDPMNPRSAPRFDVGSQKAISDVAKNHEPAMSAGLDRAFGEGVKTTMSMMAMKERMAAAGATDKKGP
jgi:hypothetical protein